jgi:hypothetical protein
MLFSRVQAVYVGLVALAGSCLASPAPVVVPLDPRVVQPLNELVVRDPMKLARAQYVEKRLSADFDLARTWKNEVLFGGYIRPHWRDSLGAPLYRFPRVQWGVLTLD